MRKKKNNNISNSSLLTSHLLKGGNSMNNQDRQLIVDTLGEMRELRGEMREFKEHVMGRVEKLEKKDSERSKERISIISLLISGTALIISIIINFFKHGGK